MFRIVMTKNVFLYMHNISQSLRYFVIYFVLLQQFRFNQNAFNDCHLRLRIILVTAVASDSLSMLDYVRYKFLYYYYHHYCGLTLYSFIEVICICVQPLHRLLYVTVSEYLSLFYYCLLTKGALQECSVNCAVS